MLSSKFKSSVAFQNSLKFWTISVIISTLINISVILFIIAAPGDTGRIPQLIIFGIKIFGIITLYGLVLAIWIYFLQNLLSKNIERIFLLIIPQIVLATYVFSYCRSLPFNGIVDDNVVIKLLMGFLAF